MSVGLKFYGVCSYSKMGRQTLLFYSKSVSKSPQMIMQGGSKIKLLEFPRQKSHCLLKKLVGENYNNPSRVFSFKPASCSYSLPSAIIIVWAFYLPRSHSDHFGLRDSAEKLIVFYLNTNIITSEPNNFRIIEVTKRFDNLSQVYEKGHVMINFICCHISLNGCLVRG